jgi:hypothetical protein
MSEMEGVVGAYSISLATYPSLEQLQQQLIKVISILFLYLYYSTTLYLFFQTNTPVVLSISLSTLFKYTFLFFYLI